MTYGYCLMDNHGHLLIDVNGADISRIMKEKTVLIIVHRLLLLKIK